MTAVSEQIGTWLTEFTAQPKAEAWLQELRDAGFQRFAESGFPTTHDEEWRFTNVVPIARRQWKILSGERSTLPEAVRQNLAQHLPQTNPFVALNSAFLSNVVFHVVPRGKVEETPIEITYETEGSGVAAQPRTIVLVGANAQCTIVETYKGTGEYFTNAVTEIVVEDSAVVDHYKVVLESPASYHIGTMQASLGRSSNFSSHSIVLGGALVRNDVGVVLAEGTEATLNGLYLATGTQHIDNHTVIDHAKPHGTSHELYKGILDGNAHAVFNGRIMVRKDAQKT